MTFTTQTFLIFFGVFSVIYFLTINNLRYNNLITLIGSYIFYGWWDYRFLSLILISSLVDFVAGQKIDQTERKSLRRRWLFISIITNLSILGFFKYFNFFFDSFQALYGSITGHPPAPLVWNIILPVGISFYTFQSLSYTIDIYNRKFTATNSLLSFLTFVSFFPQLVAGPIERASHLLPQIMRVRRFSYELAVVGFRQILWGMFKKLVIADNIALVIDPIFANPSAQSGPTLALATWLFGFQIYCDFSGYTDIAIGIAKIFGIRINTNFRRPYLAKNIQEFWRRWHISLSTWFRDYVFFPLGGSRKGGIITSRNLLIVFLISGLWHGANWTFVIWGGYHALLYFVSFAFSSFFKLVKISVETYISSIFKITVTLTAVMLGWVFFRAASLGDALEIFGRIFNFEDWMISSNYLFPTNAYAVLVGTMLLLIVEIVDEKLDIGRRFQTWPQTIRWTSYIACIFSIALVGAESEATFIYFQF